MSGNAKPPPSKPSWPQMMRSIGPYMNIGWTFVVALGLGILVGRWLDSWLGTDPWLFLIGAVFGIIVGFYSFFLIVLRK
jgi:ATP synthase protein I